MGLFDVGILLKICQECMGVKHAIEEREKTRILCSISIDMKTLIKRVNVYYKRDSVYIEGEGNYNTIKFMCYIQYMGL